MSQRILVVDDDQVQVDVVSYLLQRAAFLPVAAFDAATAVRLFEDELPALVILDVQIGEADGLELLQRFKKQRPAVPILLLTVLNAEDDRVRGLELGADDYLTKPFGYRELIARVRAMLRRATARVAEPVQPERIVVGSVVLNSMLHEVTRDGQHIDLSPTEFRLLKALMQRPDTLVPTETLLREVWGHQDMSARNVLRVTASRLRAKLEPDPAAPRWLHTVPGEGLMFRTASASRADPSTSAEGPVELGVIEELRELLSDSTDQSLQQLNERFVESSERHLEAMRAGVVANDAENVAREAHRMRGNSGSLGAQRVATKCAAIEERARAGDLGAVPELLSQLRMELAAYESALAPMLESVSS